MSIRALGLEAAIDPALVVWIATVLAVILAAGIAIVLLVRRFFLENRRQSSPAGPTFSLEQLRQLRRVGKITDEEYKVLMEKILREI